MKTLPKEDERKRKYKKQSESNQIAKKSKQEEPIMFSGLDLTEAWINERLLPIVATQIIMDTLVCKKENVINNLQMPC